MFPRPLRTLRAGGRVLQAHLGRLSSPLKINLCVTYWCQYRCQTCNIWQRKPVDELTTDELLSFIDRNRDVGWVDVTGGEIFLRSDIEIVMTAMLKSWRQLAVLHFPTNGFLTDRIVAVTRVLAALNTVPIIVTVSVDGDGALNDEIRGMRGGFDRQLETFVRLRRLRNVRAVIGVTLSRHNVRHVDRILSACRAKYPALCPSDLHLNVAQTSRHYYGTGENQAIGAPPDELLRALDFHASLPRRSWSMTNSLERRYLQLLKRFTTTGVTPQPCHALRSSCFIDPWGVVYPCITFDRPLASLRDHEMRLGPIWNAPATVDLQREIWHGNCPQCWTACEAYQTMLGNMLAPWRVARL